MAGNERRNLADGPRPHKARGRQSHTHRGFERILDLHAHERVETEVGQGLIVAQAVGLHPQHRTHDVAHGLQSRVEEQVTNGVAVRMAVLWLITRTHGKRGAATKGAL